MATELTIHDQSQDGGGMMEVAATREAQEVQAAMIVAQRFPRDIISAENRILVSCSRIRLAETAMYSYPKGGSRIEGPSIRLAELMAQCWGNLDFGIKELEQREGESVVMSYCHDLQTNTRQTKVFTVKHEMKAHDKIKKLTDPREIYELVANQGARRLRSCILGIIPGDIQEAAIDACRKTIAGDNTMPLIDQIKKWAGAFEKHFAVTRDMLEKRLGHNLEATDSTELLTFRTIYNSLKDGMSKREDWFDIGPADSTSTDPDSLTSGKKTRKKAAKKSANKKEDVEGDPQEEIEQTPQEAGEEVKEQVAELFGGEESVIPDEADATTDDIERLRQIADLKLASASFATSSANRNKLASFAAVGLVIKDLNNPTHGESVALLAALKDLTSADIKEAFSS